MIFSLFKIKINLQFLKLNKIWSINCLLPVKFKPIFVEFMLLSDLYHMIPLIHTGNSSVWFVLNHEVFVV